ncbi:MAG: hypothetical protein ACHQQQ_09790 [Bacteroidota bacterium]
MRQVMDFNKLKSHLQQIDNKSISNEELRDLVHLSWSIVQAYLRNLRYTIVKLCSGHGLSETDLAQDCVAEAFSQKPSGEYDQLQNFINSLRDTIGATPEQEIFHAYRSFLIRITDAQLSQLYAQADPMGSKIYRNIRDCVKISKYFSPRKDFRGRVLYPKNIDPLDHLQAYPIDKLQCDFLESAKRGYSTHELIEILFNVLNAQEDYRRSIPLIDVVQLFKKIFQSELEYETKDYQILHDSLSLQDIELVRSEVENALKEKIVVTYYTKGKMDRDQSEAVWLACRDMITDWCKPEVCDPSLFEYLTRYYHITEDRYENEFRVKMEYLLKLARQEFAARLNEEL